MTALALLPVLVGLLCLPGSRDLMAQERLIRSASIAGQVRDTARQPVRRANLCAFGQLRRAAGCASADTAGGFRIDSLYPDVYTLQIECETNGPGYSKILALRRVQAGDGQTATADIMVVPNGCDQRPLEVVQGVFSGHWASGFELNDFVSCQDSLKHALVERRNLRPGELWELPAGERVPNGTRWFVRWRGALIGPRGFVVRYRMLVDDVLEMRSPSADDCET